MESGYFVQFITLEQRDRPRPEIARQWCHQLVAVHDHTGVSSGVIAEQVAYWLLPDKVPLVQVRIWLRHCPFTSTALVR